MLTTFFPSPTATTARLEPIKPLPALVTRERIGWRQIAQVLLLVLLPCVCYWPALAGTFL